MAKKLLQIIITGDFSKQIKFLAKHYGISMSGVVRMLVMTDYRRIMKEEREQNL